VRVVFGVQLGARGVAATFSVCSAARRADWPFGCRSSLIVSGGDVVGLAALRVGELGDDRVERLLTKAAGAALAPVADECLPVLGLRESSLKTFARSVVVMASC
jgi:hypothetical protein